MSDNLGSSPDLNTSASVSGNGVLLATVIFLFLVVFLISLFYLYAKKAMNYMQPHAAYATDNLPVIARGLDSAVLQSLPVTVFDAKEFKDDRLECAVCLSDINEGEEVRILPKCNHRFHVKCIDMWFHSHSTCPLCRSPVGTDLVHSQESNAEYVRAQSLNAVSREGYVTRPRGILPTSVLIHGTQDDDTAGTVQEAASSSNSTCSSRTENPGTLVIDVPRRTLGNIVPSPKSPLPTSVMPQEEMKSPVSARFWSFQRLFSIRKQLVGPSGSHRGGDVEQGIVHTPKTPPSFEG